MAEKKTADITKEKSSDIEELKNAEEVESEDGELEDDAFEEETTVDDLDDDEDDDDGHDEETAEALEELESEELKLTEDEASEALLVDEVKELRAMRREELTMNVDAQGQKSDEFVCQSCFMVKRMSQMANKRKMICQDCVA
ncbi:MAG: DUF4193 family protein [Acidimicrobiia bacterium]